MSSFVTNYTIGEANAAKLKPTSPCPPNYVGQEAEDDFVDNEDEEEFEDEESGDYFDDEPEVADAIFTIPGEQKPPGTPKTPTASINLPPLPGGFGGGSSHQGASGAIFANPYVMDHGPAAKKSSKASSGSKTSGGSVSEQAVVMLPKESSQMQGRKPSHGHEQRPQSSFQRNYICEFCSERLLDMIQILPESFSFPKRS
ncbi:hypothetical protein Ddc_15467 [Ditylenchus destructor]|nr:hypothetical protein Ddc_15467 [Ditylenchus destructor]